MHVAGYKPLFKRLSWARGHVTGVIAASDVLWKLVNLSACYLCIIYSADATAIILIGPGVVPLNALRSGNMLSLAGFCCQHLS